MVFCDPKWSSFLIDVTKPTPVCFLLPLSIHETIRDLLAGNPFNDASLRLLKEEAPSFVSLLLSLGKSLPPFSYEFFQLLLSVAAAPFAGIEAPSNAPTLDPFEYFPSLPQIRRRENFKADAKQVLFSFVLIFD